MNEIAEVEAAEDLSKRAVSTRERSDLLYASVYGTYLADEFIGELPQKIAA